ncbi:TonB-dependent receptor plug domain-containing protein [Cupriavidus basilensis]
MVVSASRSEQRRFDAPAAVDSVPVDPLVRHDAARELVRSTGRRPGAAVRDRQNYSQDLQLSVRGFGTRSTFGVRGVRLYVDGIPATMPDGQGQAATADLANASRVEVLRGPFAQMYGNASGGVVQVFTPDLAQERLHWPRFDRVRFRRPVAGRRGARRRQRQAGRHAGRMDLPDRRLPRPQRCAPLPAQRQGRGPAHRRHARDRPVQLLQPAARARSAGAHAWQADANPRQSVPAATQFDTGKTVEQTQAGVVVDHKLTEADSLQARLYGGTRQLNQRLGMSGIAATSSGGIVDLDRSYGGGVALSWARRTTAGGLPLQWTAGVEANGMRDGRTGFVNNNGTQGALRRDETDKASDFGAFAQFGLDSSIRRGSWSAACGQAGCGSASTTTSSPPPARTTAGPPPTTMSARYWVWSGTRSTR